MVRSRSTKEPFQGLREASGDAALPYSTVTRWVTTFRESRDAVQDNFHTRLTHVENNAVYILLPHLDTDCPWTARELAGEVGVYHKTLLHNLHDILDYRKLAAHMILIKSVTLQHRRAMSRVGFFWF